jgi:hypothetical protein
MLKENSIKAEFKKIVDVYNEEAAFTARNRHPMLGHVEMAAQRNGVTLPVYGRQRLG